MSTPSPLWFSLLLAGAAGCSETPSPQPMAASASAAGAFQPVLTVEGQKQTNSKPTSPRDPPKTSTTTKSAQ